MRALMMVAVINPSTSTHCVPEGFASTPFHYQRRFAMPVTRNRSVSFEDDIEIFEIPIGSECNMNPCSVRQRTHNPVCITKDDRFRKETIEARESVPYSLHKCCSQLPFGSCMGNHASATSIATVILAVVTASDPT